MHAAHQLRDHDSAGYRAEEPVAGYERLAAAVVAEAVREATAGNKKALDWLQASPWCALYLEAICKGVTDPEGVREQIIRQVVEGRAERRRRRTMGLPA